MASRLEFVQEYCEIQIAWRLPIVSKQYGSFTAMLRAMIDNM